MKSPLIANNLTVVPRPMVSREGLQRVDVKCELSRAAHLTLRAFGEGFDHVCEVALPGGESFSSALLPPPEANTETTWQLLEGNRVLAETRCAWEKPREWTIYAMISSHTDIGLHNSQYIQRHSSVRFLDEAVALCDATERREEPDRYRYTVEGTWFWNNYPADRGEEAARKIIEDYVKSGKIGVCGGVAGNHTQAYGFEEMCRSAYGRRELLEKWGVDAKTMSMIDNNGLSWALVQPYAEAGFRNILFSPNQWNPLPSTVWPCDRSVSGYTWNCAAGGGGARVDVRLESALPLVFRWRAADGESELLVCCTQTQYGHAASAFGFGPDSKPTDDTLSRMEQRTAATLTKMEARCPYDLCVIACYSDDQEPSLDLTDTFARWNERWRWPRIRALGNPDAPFDLMRERFYEQIPVLSGDITGGWYQHPLSASELLADKLEADRRLADAEKYACLAGDGYPAEDFARAWRGLVYNDEHSYGTSGYQGRRVYETWMQHRDWIETARETAEQETLRALSAVAGRIRSRADAIAVFNPTALTREERVLWQGREAAVASIPPFGYKTAPRSAFAPSPSPAALGAPPVVENRHYRLRFAANGAMTSIYDKALGRELLDPASPYGANGFVYTADNHHTFVTPGPARFTLEQAEGRISVTARMDEPVSGASLAQRVTLDELHRRIDIENRVEHARDLVNNHRYHRYLYYAFPFAVERARRICQLNGCEAEYAEDVTGHGTDVYMAAHEWCCAENGEYGVGLIQLDTQLVEFDHIHPDKTDFANAGDGSAVFSYVANDWLQMHQTGGSHVNFRLRYAIASYEGDHGRARLAETAEACAFPVTALALSENPEGELPEDAHSFLQTNRRFVALKRAEDGRGLIARLYGERSGAKLAGDFAAELERAAADESPKAREGAGAGFTTLRLGANKIHLSVRGPSEALYTGLITRPRAARGENDGQLYLLWGQDPNAAYYELYRAEREDFVPSPETFVARVEPGEYRVARYVDEGLAIHTAYCYRVRAVSRSGEACAFSEVFRGVTREPIEE